MLLLLVLSAVPVKAGPSGRLTPNDLKTIRFDQKLNEQVTLDLRFTDEQGRQVKLGDYFGQKPVILILGYYECPMLCGLVHNGVLESLAQVKWDAGDKFSVVSVSIDPAEGPKLAAAKKDGYVKKYGRPGAADGWHFLTGKSDAISKLAEEVGFHFAYDTTTKQFAHPSGVVIITPRGKVARYFFGVSYAPAQMEAALKDASSNRIGVKVQEFLFLCFHYDPTKSPYANAILISVRVCGILTLAGLIGVVWWSHRASRRNPA